jgi:hypothetical protein
MITVRSPDDARQQAPAWRWVAAPSISEAVGDLRCITDRPEAARPSGTPRRTDVSGVPPIASEFVLHDRQKGPTAEVSHPRSTPAGTAEAGRRQASAIRSCPVSPVSREPYEPGPVGHQGASPSVCVVENPHGLHWSTCASSPKARLIVVMSFIGRPHRGQM